MPVRVTVNLKLSPAQIAPAPLIAAAGNVLMAITAEPEPNVSHVEFQTESTL